MFHTLSRLGRALGLALAAFTATAPSSSAQCAPDNLDGGPCCSQASVNLPVFPQMLGQDALWICFDDCQPSLQRLFCVSIGQPKPVLSGGNVVCGEYTIRFQLRDCATGQLHWSGGVRATYSRNWGESQVPGALNLTVWRFIINGDLLPTNNVPNNPCERPLSLNQYSRLYVSGHIDYALDCATNQWSVAWAVSHECDRIHHAPGSVRPAPAAGFDPGRSYSIVGPGSTFVPSPSTTAVSDGPITQGSFRWNRWSSSPAICTYREPANGNFVAQNLYCECPSTTSPGPQYVDSFVVAQGMCGSSVAPTPASRFTQKRIGTWSNPAVFPGVEDVLFDFGELLWTNGCNGVVKPEWYEGSETIGGYLAVDFAGLVLGRQFEDLGSCNASPANPAKRIGAPHIVHSILNFNMP